MQDLLLWRCLRDPDHASPEKLVALFGDLAQEPLKIRLPFFGILGPLLAQPETAVRAAAVRILAGAQGIPAWRHLVGALRDPELYVRLAAAQALRLSAVNDPGRWIHAYFHPDPEVRQHAQKLGAPQDFSHLFPFPEMFDAESFEDYSIPYPTLASTGIQISSVEYQKIQDTLAGIGPHPETMKLLVSLLDRSEMDQGQRLPPADHVARSGHGEAVFPILAQACSYELNQASAEHLEIAARGIMTLGMIDQEDLFVDVLANRDWQNEDQKALETVVTQASGINTRYWARDRMLATPAQTLKLLRLARSFAWGVEMGLYLTGTRFQIEMLVNEHDLGYTRLRENKVHISPLPILRGERNGAEVVRALILHEYGHHLFHKGEEEEATWKQADETGLGRLLNLVADEHLERNLRQRHRRFGDLLKTLNAYAFQYNMREVPVNSLLRYLGERAWKVLPKVPLGAARKPGHVVVATGRLLREMEGAGHSFARFMRALRMGLGNRTRDPKVAQALALFKSSFRKSTMPQLLDVARRLRDIFGAEADMLDDFGLERIMTGDEAEWLESGRDINPGTVQQTVDGLLQTAQEQKESKGPRPGRLPAAWGLNQRPEDTFRPINKIVKIPHDPVRHATYAAKIARAARQLRRYFQNLGLGLKPQRGRLQGRQLDRAKTRDLVLKGDPRLLISRKIERFTDLFMGVAIDCSGSMAGDKLERAKLFGTLLSEGLNGQAGVDLRLFGFTDKVIFDAGDARRCGVHDLHSLDGNNDAAALWHVFQLARASRRKAKLLVMISDGLPTECSVAALKALVIRLTRWHYCCAQVAVQPLAEICFPHYVEVKDQDMDAAVRRFGEVVMRLVGQALGKG